MNKMARLDKVLKNVQLFAPLDQQCLTKLKEKMKLISLKANEILCSEGEAGDRMYIVDTGELRVIKTGKTGNPIEIARLRSGEAAGMMSLFEKEPRSAMLQAAGKVELWEIDQKTFQQLLDTQPELSKALLGVLSQRLRRETKIVAELTSHDEDNRLKVAVFDSKPYTERIFLDRNGERYALKFFESRLNRDTVAMASGFRVVCPFVNDRIDAETVEGLAKLGVQLIALRCAGYNNVDLAACRDHNISVARVPAYSPYAVAEHSIALMMALNRHTARAHNRVREGNFSLNGLVGFDMHKKTVGIFGTGKIGKCSIDILLGFGCQILASSRSVDKQLARRRGVTYVEFDELLAESDIISLHAPLTPKTHHIVNAKSIKKMKPGAMLINTSRGGLVDTQALIKGLVSGQIGSAGLDVCEEESEYFFEDFSDTVIADETLARLTTFNNVIITSHMAFLTREALANIADSTFDNITEYESGKQGQELTNAAAVPAK